MKNIKKYNYNNKDRGLLSDSYHNNLKRTIEEIISFIMDIFFSKKLNLPNEQEKNLINDLRKNTVDFSYDFQQSEAESEWMKHAKRVSELIQIDDPRRFLKWNPVKDTMGGSNYFFVTHELKYLKSNLNWRDRWKENLSEDKIGCQSPFFLYPKSSGNLIHHAYILANFENHSNKKIDDMDFVFDFGGGYGSICRLIHRLGFKGKYLVYDIPVFSQLQTFFLKSIGLPVYSINEFKKIESGICCISNYEDLERYFTEIKNLKPSKNLFVATWSISETSIRTRDSIIKFFDLFDTFIIGYQDRFGEVDNRKYFKKLITQINKLTWIEKELKHLPHHNLLLGF
jgi:hypothetical protein